MNKRLAIITGFALASGFVADAHATNGYFTHGNGAKNKSLAGAGLASPDGAIFLANNPAAALYGTGELDFGLSVFSPRRSYNASASLANGQGGAFTIGPNDLDSEGEIFYIPHIAYSWSLDDHSALGIAFYGRGGMNTEWEGGSATFDPDGPGPAPVSSLPGTFGAGKAGVDLSQALLDIAYARRINDRLTVGVSAVFAAQAFEATGLASFGGFTESFAASGGTTFPTRLSDNGHDVAYGVGAKLGFQAQLSPRLSLAGAYQSKISMGEFDDYADLFAEAGGFDIPENIKLGLTFAASERFIYSLDIERTRYSDVDSVGNPLANLFNCPTVNPQATGLSNCLGGAGGAGFGWDDMTTAKLGVEWVASDTLSLRAGYSHGSQPIPDSEVLFNILAPGVIEEHVAVGLSKQTRNNGEWNVAVMYAPEAKVSGPNPFDPTQTIALAMYQLEFEVAYTWRF